ncbi:phosphonoacetate hydrolase [Rhodobacteraceae bacterium KMM 6894]|nr:phosphonoacetate hydrolase [Rhodobacteraceae bacterium KMM 6894]
MNTHAPIVANDREYPFPKVPAITICLDGCEPAYLDAAIDAGLMPNLARMRRDGTDALAHSVIPSFTNPNNLSIATGRPPMIHGISGNYFYDKKRDEEVMMNDVRFLRAPTLFKQFHDGGARVAIVTAKDKLRALLGAGLDMTSGRARCFSAEKSATTTIAEHGLDNAASWLGMEQPDVYSAKLSEFVLAAGVKLLEMWMPDVMYLTTTDYIQHKYAPGTPVANDFYAMVDGYLGQLDALGATIVITADHGMKPKHNADGTPNVVYVQDILDEWLGVGVARVILPITDPYVVHHGALGSFATIYMPKALDRPATAERLSHVPGITHAMIKKDAAAAFQLPWDRIGNITLISDENVVIGTSKDRHDLAALDVPLRSHGGLSEQVVPFICNRVLDLPTDRQLRNFDAFRYATTAAAV